MTPDTEASLNGLLQEALAAASGDYERAFTWAITRIQNDPALARELEALLTAAADDVYPDVIGGSEQ